MPMEAEFAITYYTVLCDAHAEELCAAYMPACPTAE